MLWLFITLVLFFLAFIFCVTSKRTQEKRILAIKNNKNKEITNTIISVEQKLSKPLKEEYQQKDDSTEIVINETIADTHDLVQDFLHIQPNNEQKASDKNENKETPVVDNSKKEIFLDKEILKKIDVFLGEEVKHEFLKNIAKVHPLFTGIAWDIPDNILCFQPKWDGFKMNVKIVEYRKSRFNFPTSSVFVEGNIHEIYKNNSKETYWLRLDSKNIHKFIYQWEMYGQVYVEVKKRISRIIDTEVFLNHIVQVEKQEIENTFSTSFIKEPLVLEDFPKEEFEKKQNIENIAKILRENGINELYHFTDLSNILSIKQNNGLFSWWWCHHKNIKSKMGGDSLSHILDMKYLLHDYVRLSFTNNHPMMHIAKKDGRIPNPIVLKIDISVCFWKNTKFSDMNATRNGHNCGESISDLQMVHFETVKKASHFDILFEHEKPYYQAEVLVNRYIPLKYIKNIYEF